MNTRQLNLSDLKSPAIIITLSRRSLVEAETWPGLLTAACVTMVPLSHWPVCPCWCVYLYCPDSVQGLFRGASEYKVTGTGEQRVRNSAVLFTSLFTVLLFISIQLHFVAVFFILTTITSCTFQQSKLDTVKFTWQLTTFC